MSASRARSRAVQPRRRRDRLGRRPSCSGRSPRPAPPRRSTSPISMRCRAPTASASVNGSISHHRACRTHRRLLVRQRPPGAALSRLVERARVRFVGRRVLTRCGTTTSALVAMVLERPASCHFDPAYRDVPDPGAVPLHRRRRRVPWHLPHPLRGHDARHARRLRLRGMVCAPGLLRCTPCLPSGATCDGSRRPPLQRRRPDQDQGGDLRREPRASRAARASARTSATRRRASTRTSGVNTGRSISTTR